ncbi:MAG: shikimate dehydrogenase [Candidatus Latescibacterota bacterium]|nr:MAG: shikimate dehydrogenase [Candidatus Latescibacterota bacterium]
MNRRLEIQLGARAVGYRGTSATRVFGILGQPVRHSLSPRFQSAAFAASALDAVYLRFEVAAAELQRSVERMREQAASGPLAGINVTLPHKHAIVGLVDALDEEARLTGAVNTIRFEPTASGTPLLRGFNTDVHGLLAALDEHAVTMSGAVVVIVGAGGAARAAVAGALHSGAAAVRVLNRAPVRAQEMLDAVVAVWRGALPALSCAPLDAAPRALRDAAVLIQTTPVGMQPDDPLPVLLSAPPAALFVLDTLYAPPQTALLRRARSAGLRCSNGLDMLLHQGAASFGLWTGIDPPLEAMRRSLGLA